MTFLPDLRYTGGMVSRKYLIAMVGLLVVLTACTPPTPPPSPTPWPTPTSPSVKIDTSPTAQRQPTPTQTPTSSPTATPQPEPTPTPPVTTIEVWESLPETQSQALTQDIEVFQSEFPQYAVTLHHYDSRENFITPLIAGEISFDVVLASPVLLSSLWRAEQLAPMSDFFPPSFIDGFAAPTLLGASQDDELWGLSDTAGFHLLLFYNRDLVNTPPTDSDKLFDLAEKLTQNSRSQGEASRWGLAVNSYDPLWLVPWLAPYGGWLTDEAGQPTLDTPAMEAALTLYLSWQADSTGVAPVAIYDEAYAQFLNGDIAMMISGDWASGELARAGRIDWGVASLPAVTLAGESKPAAPLVLARYWGVSHTTQGNRAMAAATFLEFITRPERQLAWTTRFGQLPTQHQALDDPTIMKDPVLQVSAAQMLAGRAIPLGTDANMLLDAMRGPLRGVIDGELTPAEAAEMMQANIDSR